MLNDVEENLDKPVKRYFILEDWVDPDGIHVRKDDEVVIRSVGDVLLCCDVLIDNGRGYGDYMISIPKRYVVERVYVTTLASSTNMSELF